MAKSRDNLKAQIELLQQMQKEYKKLTNKSLPKFDTQGASQVNDSVKQMNVLLEIAKDEAELLNDGFLGISNSLASVVQEMAKTNQHTNNTLKAFRGIQGIVNKFKYDQEGIEKLTRKQLVDQKTKLKKLQEEAKINVQRLMKEKEINGALDNRNKNFKELSEQEKAMVIAAQEEFTVFDDINKLYEARLANEQEFENALGITGATAGALQGILDKIGMGSLGQRLGINESLDEAKRQARELADEISDATNPKQSITIGDKLKIAGGFAKNLGKNLLKSLGPMAMIAAAVAAIVKAFTFLDSASGELAKEFGISAEEGRKLVASSNKVAMHQADTLVSTQDIVKAQIELNKVFGTSVAFSGEFAAEFASIAERTGLSGEVMGFFAEQALHAHTSIKEQLTDVVGMTMELNAQNEVSISRKEIEESMGKLTSAQLLTAERNTKELVNQVFQAKMLGVELSEVEAIAGSLLNFESSIQAEMEAELLTGKQLNLEIARQAALTGDLATVAEEVAKQIGDSAEFGKMNVIQQEALANAVGMTREGLADSLVEQEKLLAVQHAGFKDLSDAQNQYNQAVKDGNLTEELSNKLKEAGVMEQMESTTQQEKMAAILEKIQSLFIAIAEPLMAIISPIVDILSPILSTVVGTIGYMLEGIKALGPALKPILALLGVLWLRTKAGAIMSVIGNVWKSVGAIPFVGPVLAAAAIAGGIGYINSQKMKDGVIGPGGEMVVSGPKGSIQLDKDDSIIAGTDLGGKNKSKKKSSSSANVDLTPLVNAQNQTNALLQQLLTKKGNVYIDGNKAGYSLALADSKLG